MPIPSLSLWERAGVRVALENVLLEFLCLVKAIPVQDS
jgi:hypothetical protein